MSMNTYAAIDNGLLLTQEVAVWVILAHNKKSEGLTPEALEFVNSGRFAELAKDDSDEVPDELCKALGFDSLEFIELYELASDCLEEFQEDCIHYSRFEGSATSLTFPEEKDAIPNEWNFNGSDLWFAWQRILCCRSKTAAKNCASSCTRHGVQATFQPRSRKCHFSSHI